MTPQSTSDKPAKPVILHKNPYDPQPPASPEEIVEIEGSEYARRPVLVAYDYDYGWIVEVPTVYESVTEDGVLRVEYEFAHHHFRGIPDPDTKAMAVDIGREIAEKIGGGIVITGKPKGADTYKKDMRELRRRAARAPDPRLPRAGEKFIEYAERLWGHDWAIARKTKKNLARYARCLTPKEYKTARTRWEAEQN